MEQWKKRKTPRMQEADYNREGTYFITICTQNRRCILSRIVGNGDFDRPKIELTKYGEIAEKYIQQLDSFYSNISIEDYVIMPNHIHILIFLKETEDLNVPLEGQSGTPIPTNLLRANSTFSQFISTFKRFCNKEYGENIWQGRSYDHIIRSQEDYDQHLRYIYENPTYWHFDKLYNSANQD